MLVITTINQSSVQQVCCWGQIFRINFYTAKITYKGPKGSSMMKGWNMFVWLRQRFCVVAPHYLHTWRMRSRALAECPEPVLGCEISVWGGRDSSADLQVWLRCQHPASPPTAWRVSHEWGCHFLTDNPLIAGSFLHIKMYFDMLKYNSCLTFFS